MNYLAHFYLSGDAEKLIIGNFVADFVKGSQFREFPDDIGRGILMHREIDNFTDNHPIVLETKRRLYPVYHKYAAVIVDIYYDHMLAAHWNKYNNTPLKQYAGEIYSILQANKGGMPSGAQYMLKYMVRYDWLSSYASVPGIGRILFGMSRRTKFKSDMEKSVRELKQDYDLIKQEFDTFLPEIEQHIGSFMQS